MCRTCPRCCSTRAAPGAYTLSLQIGRAVGKECIFQEVALSNLNRELDSTELRDVISCYELHFEDDIKNAKNYRILAGVEKLLAALSERSTLLLGIQTGNLMRTASAKLRRGNLDSYFAFGGYASDSRFREEIVATSISRGRACLANKDISKIVVIGDAPQDVLAAHHNNALSVAVGTGAASEETLKALSPSLYLNDLSDPAPLFDLLKFQD